MNALAALDDVHSVLTELLRLYDWRNEIGRIERDFNHDKKQVTTWLNRYGREKKAAWEAARRVLAAVPAETAFASDYRAKIERDAATIKVLRLLLREAYDFLNSQVVLPGDYDDWEKRYEAFIQSTDRLAAGVAFVTDTGLGGS